MQTENTSTNRNKVVISRNTDESNPIGSNMQSDYTYSTSSTELQLNGHELTGTNENIPHDPSYINDTNMLKEDLLGPVIKKDNEIVSYDDVANYFLAYSNEIQEPITNLKLQKMVYYAQAWYLANYGKPLFNVDFEAWVHGPVIRDLYNKYKHFGYKPIILDITLKDVNKRIDDEIVEFLNEIIEVYMPFTGYHMELMTHHELPWIEARNGYESDENCSNIISKESMKQYYGKKIQDKSNQI